VVGPGGVGVEVGLGEGEGDGVSVGDGLGLGLGLGLGEGLGAWHDTVTVRPPENTPSGPSSTETTMFGPRVRVPEAVTVPPGTASTSRRMTEPPPEATVRFDPGCTDDWFSEVEVTVQLAPCSSAGTAWVTRTWIEPGLPRTMVVMGMTIDGWVCAPACGITAKAKPRVSRTSGATTVLVLGLNLPPQAGTVARWAIVPSPWAEYPTWGPVFGELPRRVVNQAGRG
jgi:hypothetical protein